MENENPTILAATDLPTRNARGTTSRMSPISSIFDDDENTSDSMWGEEDETIELIDAQEVYDLISTISDPEHPVTLGQLAVVNLPHIKVEDNPSPGKLSYVKVEITPTITHCSLATLIGLGVRLRLDRCLPPRFRVEVKVKEGSHESESQVNKQLADKERVAAACENEQLMGVISGMLQTCK